MEDPILYAVRTRMFEGPQHQDDLWVRSLEAGTKNDSFYRVSTEFVRVNLDTMVIHVEENDTLRSFICTLKEMED